MNKFWRPFCLLQQSALRQTHTCSATTALATPAILPMLAMLAMLAMPFPMLLPATPVSPPLPLSPPLELPLLPSPLSEELTPAPDVMLPTLLVSSTQLRHCSKQLC